MSLNDLVHSTVSADGAGLKQVGFGVMLLACYHNKYADRVRTYEDLSGLVTDGFAVTDPAYLMTQRVFMQEPRPDKVMIGRLALPHTQTVKWTPTVTTAGFVHKMTLRSGTKSGTATVTNVTTTIDSVQEIVEAMVIAIQALNDFDPILTVTEDDTAVTIASTTPGVIFYVSAWTEKLEDVTADPGIATDLANIQLANDDWYGVVVDLPANTIQHAAATWVESAKKLGAWQTSDWQADQSDQTSDLGDILQGLSYARSITYYSDNDTGSYMAVGGMAERFPHDPGSPPGAGGTWAHKTIKGAVATNLSSTRKTNLRTKNYCVYIPTAGRSHTLDGKSSSGEFLDKTRFLDWVNVRIQESVATLKLNSEKIPYTDGGVSQEVAAVSAILDIGVKAGGFSPTTYPTVTAPKVANVSNADKASRTLNGLNWSATMAGAIHLTNVSGTVLT